MNDDKAQSTGQETLPTPEPQQTVNLSTGLPDDAVPLPDDSPEPDAPSPSDEDVESRLAEIEQKADTLRQPAITDPNVQQQPTEADRLAAIEQWIYQQSQQQQQAQLVQQQPQQQQQQQSGASSAYAGDAYTEDPYVQNDPYATSDPQPAQQQPQQPDPNVMMDWLGYLYQQGETLQKRLDSYETRHAQDTQKNMFKDRYNVDDDTIDRALVLAQGGDVLDAFTLLEGRSHAGGAERAAREQRSQDRDLAGTPTQGGGSPQANDADTHMTAAKAAYEAACALPSGMDKDNAMIQFRRNYGDVARMFMESQIGGQLTTQAVVDTDVV